MAISAEKWLVMSLIFVISLFLGLFPYFLLPNVKSWGAIMAKSGYHVFLTVLSCVGAGVLLTTALMHMLPENREQLAEIHSIWATLEEHFPLAETLTLCGFALIYLIEEFAHVLLAGASAPGHSHSHDNHDRHHHHLLSRNSLVHRLSIASGASVKEKTKQIRPSIASIGAGSTTVQVISQPTPSSQYDSTHHNNHSHARTEPYGPNEIIVHDDPVVLEDAPVGLAARIRSLLAVLALSFHAIMEGIAIGIEDSSNVWFMFGAISAHKFVISFVMGMELCASKAKLTTLLTSVFVFAILSPIGIGIGSSLAEENEPHGLTVCLIQGFATGTILYVVFFEILSRERGRKSGSLKTLRLAGLIQFISVTVGLVAMAFLLNIVDHEHHAEECQEHDH